MAGIGCFTAFFAPELASGGAYIEGIVAYIEAHFYMVAEWDREKCCL